MKDIDKKAGYSFSVDRESVVHLDYKLLLGTHDFFLKLYADKEFTHPEIFQKCDLCRKEIERRLVSYDLFINRPE